MVERIKMLCKEKGVSMLQMGKDVGIESKSIARWDDNIPSIDRVIKVADYFGVSIDYLCGRTEKKETANQGGLPDEVILLLELLSDPRAKDFVLRQLSLYKEIAAPQPGETSAKI